MSKQFTLIVFAAAIFCSCKKNQLPVTQTDAGNAKLVALVVHNAPAALSYKNITLNGSGYNPRNFTSVNPWTNSPGLKAGLDNAEANMIRYPGGTFGDYWDYDNDQMFSTSGASGFVSLANIDDDAVHDHIMNGQIYKNTVADVATGAGFTGGTRNVVFQMNMTTPGYDYYHTIYSGTEHPGDTSAASIWKKMLDDRYARFKRMLDRVQSTTSIPVRYIELGNEYYLGHPYAEEAFPTGAEFGIACTYIANKIKHDYPVNTYPNLRIAATGSSMSGTTPARKADWNHDLYTKLNKYTQGGTVKDNGVVQNITMHMYEAFVPPGTYTPANYQDQIVAWCNAVKDHFDDSNAATWFDDNWRIWYTETNANWESGITTIPPDQQTWGQNLMDAYGVLRLYDKGAATLVLQSPFNSQIVDASGTIYNRAKALTAFMRATKDARQTSRVNFDGATDISTLHSATSLSVIQGYAFSTSSGTPTQSDTRLVLINLSSSTVTVDLSSIFGARVNVTNWNHGNASDVYPSITPSTTDFAAGSVDLLRLSVNYIELK